MSTAAKQRAQGITAALGAPNYRLLWTSSFLSACAQWAFRIGSNWLVLKLSGSAGWVGLVTFAGMAPFFVATPLGGILADRVERRRLAAIAQSVSFAVAAVLAALTLTGGITPWQLVVLSFVIGCARSVETPTTTSIVPNLIGNELLLNAISLISVGTFGARLFGPGLGGIVQVQFGAGGVFIGSAALWLAASLAMARVHAPASYLHRQGDGQTSAGVWAQTKQTLSYIGGTPMIGLLFLLVGLHCGLTMSVDAILPVYVKNTLHGNGGAYSLLVMATGAGALVGTLGLAGLRSGSGKGKLLLITGIGSGLSTAMLGLSPSFGVAFFAGALMGATQGMFMAIGSTLLQEVVPDALRGRISSAYLMVTGGIMAFADLGSGYLTDVFGSRLVLLAPALLFVVLLLVIGGVRPNLRRIIRTGTLELARANA